MMERRNPVGSRLAAALIASAALALAGGCAGLLESSAASDREQLKPRVVVLEIDGKGSKSIRKRLVRLLADRYELVPRKRYHSVARRLEATSMQPYDVSTVSAELGVDALVEGRLRRVKRRRYALALTLYDGVNGKVLDEIEVTLRSRRLAGKARHQARTGLYQQLDALTPVGDVMDDDGGAAIAREDGDARRRGSRLKNVRKASRSERRARRAAQRDSERAQTKRERARAEREARAQEKRERAQTKREARAQKRERADERRRGKRARDREVARADREERAEREEARAIETARDDRGQVIDDEMPDVLR